MKKIYILIIAFLTFIIPLKNMNSVNASNITLNQTSIILGVNHKATLKVTVSQDISSNNIIYSSSHPQIATIDNNGLIIAKSIGKAIITVTVNGNKEICEVNVIEKFVPITAISLDKKSIDLTLNANTNLNPIITPSNASNKTIIYTSSNPQVATVNSKGIVTAKSIGTTYITASSPDSTVKDTCKINVTNKISLKNITTNTSTTIKENEKQTLTINYIPSNATNKTVTWKSSNNNIVTVTNNGVITGINPGSATITIISQDGGHVATCKVTVEEISKAVQSIAINKKELTMNVGTEETLTVSFIPEYAENKKVIWKSSDESIAIVENGIINALKAGSVTITAISEDGEKTDTCKLTVTSLPIESISFEQEEYTTYLNEPITLNTISNPEDSIIENPIWISSDESIATIENGVLTPLSTGTVTITISNQDNSINATTTVNVLEKIIEPLSITIKGYELDFNPDKKDYTLTIGSETKLTINTNVDSDKVVINGNKDLKNGSIITVTIKGDNTKTYIINIRKKEKYTIYFIVAISILLFLNIIRILTKNKKKIDE